LLAGEGAIEGQLRFLVAEEIDGGPDQGRLEEIGFSLEAPGGRGAPARADKLFNLGGEVSGAICIASEPSAVAPYRRLRVRVENLTRWSRRDAARDEVLRASLLGTHLILAAAEGTGFCSVLDPPEALALESKTLANKGSFPVLAGAAGRNDLLLAAPIILYDHPALAPESPGETFDATEIDELLAIRTRTLTDQEKREVRETDPRARALLERAEGLSEAQLERLHGALREMRGPEMAPRTPLYVPGSRVRLKPGPRRTDVQDLLFAGRVATVEKVIEDVDGRTHLAVTLDDDPAAEMHRWKGRFHYYATDEVEPL
jgi:hypothetical protein